MPGDNDPQILRTTSWVASVGSSLSFSLSSGLHGQNPDHGSRIKYGEDHSKWRAADEIITQHAQHFSLQITIACKDVQDTSKPP